MIITKIHSAWDFDIIRVYTIEELRELAEVHNYYSTDIFQFISWLEEEEKESKDGCNSKK